MAKIFVICFTVLLSLSACANSDSERTDLIITEGVKCMVVRNSANRIIALDCDWDAS